MSTPVIVSHVPCTQTQLPAQHKPLFAVYGVFAGALALFEEPLARPLQAGDVTELEGRFVRMIPNHNGQRLQAVDCHEQVVAAMAHRLVNWGS